MREKHARSLFSFPFGRGAAAAALALLAAASPLAAGPGGTSVFRPVSSPADAVHHYSLFVLGITGAIFAVVFTMLVVAVVRFRRRPGDDASEPPQVYGSDQVEVAWTVIPVLIVIVLSLTTARTVFEVQNPARPSNALQVTVVGRQWWWELRYPAYGIVTANELHVPVSDPAHPTPTFLRLESADVAHSFWVPRLAGKTDLIPNRVNEMWIDPRETGLFEGQCAEYCGTEHAKMLLRVYVHPREEFERWVAAQQAAPPPAAEAAEGRRVFETTACLNCHTIRGTVGNGLYGPDLTHLMSRETLAAGAAANTPESLRAWVRDPNAVKPGALMPAMQLDERRLDALVAYLRTLR
ncbi:MAG TPA: cytochrome c oxidase subunit II [Thermoanaerobaculia bacterium]|nr:cytochrome c oxidase subunit II [Thermoanaerobaculia bacterium]